LTRGRAGTPEPFDLGAVAGSDELFEALSTRRMADLSPGRIDDDPAASLLAALVADVDAGAPPLPVPARVTCGMPQARRRGVRVVVTFGVAALVLTSAGAAAAGGGNGVGAMRTTHGPARITGGERSNANVERQVPAVQPRTVVDRPTPRRQDGARREMSVQSKPDPSRSADGPLDDRSEPWQRHRSSHAPSETDRPTPEPTPPPWAPLPTPTPNPTADPTAP
jgi:hypothetical protein